MFKKLFRWIKLLIADIRWYEEQHFAIRTKACIPHISIDSYKPSFVAKHSPEEMAAIIKSDKEKLIKELEDMIDNYNK